jgi:predicted nucleic acid-binding protein
MAKLVLGSKEDFLRLKLRPVQVECEELGALVYVLPPSVPQHEEILALIDSTKEEGAALSIHDVLYSTVAEHLVDETGERLFADEDIDQLLERISWGAVNELYGLIMSLEIRSASKVSEARDRVGKRRR